MMERGCTLCR